MKYVILTSIVLIVALVSGCSKAAGVEGEKVYFQGEGEKVYLSSPVKVDKVYRSMEGPVRKQLGKLSEPTEAPELLWVTGFKAIVVDREDKKKMSWDFNCHTNFDIKNFKDHSAYFKGMLSQWQPRLFVISQGQEELNLPEGFGIPMMSNVEFRIANMVKNLDPKIDDVDIRYRNVVVYTQDKELHGKKMTPLYGVNGLVLASLNGGNAIPNLPNPTKDQEAACCTPGVRPDIELTEKKAVENGARKQFTDEMGREFTGHWVLKPGKEVRQTLITKQLGLQYDTKVHFILAHMHPFAVSLSFKDVTTDQILFTSEFTTGEFGQLLKTGDYSSKEGIPVYKDHEYALISTYNNTSDKDSDAMSIMYFYLEDKKFKKPNL